MPKRKSMISFSEILQNPDIVNQLAEEAEQEAENRFNNNGQEEVRDASAPPADSEDSEADREEEREEEGEAGSPAGENSGEPGPEAQHASDEAISQPAPPTPPASPPAEGSPSSEEKLASVDERLNKLVEAIERAAVVATKVERLAEVIEKVERKAPGVGQKLVELIEKAVEPPQQPALQQSRPERVVIERIVPKPVPVRIAKSEQQPQQPPQPSQPPQVEAARMQAETVQHRLDELLQRASAASSPQEIEAIASEVEEVRAEVAELRRELAGLRNVDEKIAAALRPVVEQVNTALQKIAEVQKVLAEKIEAMRMQGVYVGRIKRVYPNGVVEYDLNPDDEIDMKLTNFITNEAGRALIEEMRGTREDLRYLGTRIISLLETVVMGGRLPMLPAPGMPVPQGPGYLYRPTPRTPEQIDAELDKISQLFIGWSSQNVHPQAQQTAPTPPAQQQTASVQHIQQIQSLQQTPDTDKEIEHSEESKNIDIEAAPARVSWSPPQEEGEQQHYPGNE